MENPKDGLFEGDVTDPDYWFGLAKFFECYHDTKKWECIVMEDFDIWNDPVQLEEFVSYCNGQSDFRCHIRKHLKDVCGVEFPEATM
jgi:hypothetical protein